jgi:predicted NAD/FAD-binding protein
VKIAIIGTGIAGNTAAYYLHRDHDITVFESAAHVGGHTNTVEVDDNGATLAIDTGFIVFNDRTYPNFARLLDELGQPSQPTTMSFSVRAENGSLEYNGASLNALFAQRLNILRPPFYRMVRDILRFNRQAPDVVNDLDSGETVGEFVLKHGYGQQFLQCYLVPMAAAIWSSEPVAVQDMPIRFLLQFFHNHGLLQLKDRPTWRVVTGGSREYVRKMSAPYKDRIRLGSPVREIARRPGHVEIATDTMGLERFDAVFIACHSDQALRLLKDPSAPEQEVLGDIHYQHNSAVLHTDASIMPRRRRAWAAWNYHLPADGGRTVAVSYNMNILQRLSSTTQYCVTLNCDDLIDPDKVLRKVDYEHPVFTARAVRAQARQAELNRGRSFYCGAYWRNGFHEDGVVSALAALEHFHERVSDAELHLRRAG